VNTAVDSIFDSFGIDDVVLERVLDSALSRGGSFADVFFEHRLGATVGLEDGQVNRASSRVALGAGIRVVVGDQTGFAFSEDLSLEALLKAARTAAAVAASTGVSVPARYPAQPIANRYPVVEPFGEVGIDRKIPMLNRVDERCRELDGRVDRVTVVYTGSERQVLLATSAGERYLDRRPLTKLAIQIGAVEGDHRESNGASASARAGLDWHTATRVEALCQSAVERTTVLFESELPPAGEMPVVLAAGSSGILLHEAIGHGMEADYCRQGVSIFADRVGERVAEPYVTIVDDGTHPGRRGSLNVDDEGTPVEQTVLVEGGILRSTLHDRISATYYGVQPTGNGRRQSYRYPPLPRMRNTYMLPGPHTRGEIIASVERGILAETFTNGQVEIGAGDFTFYIKTGYLIEGGRLTAPIKDANIIGNGPEILGRVAMVADDLELDDGGWTCGKQGQSVPVGLGMPTVLVSAITVGGMGAARTGPSNGRGHRDAL